MTDEEILSRFYEAEGFINIGKYNSAAVYLAIVYYFLSDADKNTQKIVKNSIKVNSNIDEVVEGAKQELKNRLERVNRIISFGTKWTYEELEHLILTRIDIEFLVNFLSNTKEIPKDYASTISSIDEWFQGISKSKNHIQDYQTAINVVKKNESLPIESKWNKIFKE